MNSKNIAFLHFSAPPIIGGVEAVIEALRRGVEKVEFQIRGGNTSE
jgi:hypothetical protein